MMRPRILLVLAALVTLILPASAGANHSTTDHVSIGPAGGNGPYAASHQVNSADGSSVLFTTAEQLVAADTDGSIDVYERNGYTTRLISTGPATGNGAFDATALAISEDGSRALFRTQEQLVPADSDAQSDIYERVGTTTTLVTIGTSAHADFFKASADGLHVVFLSAEQLAAGDTDSQTDVYDRSAGTTTLVSTGPAGGNGPFNVLARAVSGDGARIVFETSEQLAANDTDAELDLYVRAGGTTTLLTLGPTGSNLSGVTFAGASRDGFSVAFHIPSNCLGNGLPGCTDLYVNSNGTTIEVSTLDATFQGFSKDAQHLFYLTRWEGDSDLCYQDPENDYGCQDIIDFSGGTKRLVSVGGAFDDCSTPEACDDVGYRGSSADGSRAFFSTSQAMTSDDDPSGNCYDIDGLTSCADVYVNSVAGGTQLVSKHTAAGATDGLGSSFLGASEDGSRVFYLTQRKSAANDTDSSLDIFERFANATTLISTGPGGTGNGPFPVTYNGSSTDGHQVFFSTAEALVGTDTDSQVDVYDRRVIAPYVRPRGATPLRVSLVPAFVQCASPNLTHGAPLAFPSCGPPANATPSTLLGGDGNTMARSVGSVKLRVQPGTVGPPDDAEVQIAVSLTNVMKPDRSDYAGELRLELPLRLTDTFNGSPVDSGTVTDTSIFATAPCTPTADPSAGSTCALTTTADTLAPNTVMEGWKAVWGLGQIKVHDGGPDGDADTPGDNGLLAVQGVFIP